MASSGPFCRSLLASCSLSDDCAHFIGRAVLCLFAIDGSTFAGNEHSNLSAKLFNIFDNALPSTSSPSPLGCGEDCEEDHDGDCLVCGRDWGNHSGHRCEEGTRYERI